MLQFHRWLIYFILAHVTNAKSHYCTAKCSMKLHFDDDFQRRPECSERILSILCSVQITIQFNSQQIFIDFRTNGTGHIDDTYSLYAVQQLSHLFVSNYSSYKIIFDCVFANDCDWTYAKDIIQRFRNIDYVNIFDPLRTLLYDYSQKTNLKCYSQNESIDCSSGTCSSIVYDDNSMSKRLCINLTNQQHIGIDIRRFRTFPDSFIQGVNYDLYRCNRNLCNQPNIQTTVKSIIHDYASLWQISNPTQFVLNLTSRITVSNILSIIVLLLYFIL